MNQCEVCGHHVQDCDGESCWWCPGGECALTKDQVTFVSACPCGCGDVEWYSVREGTSVTFVISCVRTT